MSLISNPKSGDDVSVRQAIARLGSSKLGPTSTPKFLGVTTTTLTISGLTTNALIYPVAGLLTSLGAATNGQLPIGSTGAAPVLATITGTSNQVVSTPGAGSITLSTPQDIHTAAFNFTVAGATITDLTASRLMASDGSKVLSSVSDLTSWIAGTTDHISVSDDADGTVTLDLDTNTQTLLGSFNGIFLEKLDFTITEAAGTVTGSLEQDSGGDLIQRFSDGYTTLDCTPALTIDLTAYVGTNAVPKEVFVYILQSAKTVMAASNSDWPATEHCKVARLVLKSAAATGTDGGGLGNQNINDYASDATGAGYLAQVEQRLRQEPAAYDEGIALTLKNAAGAALTTGNSSTAVEIVTTEGKVYQLHRHTFPAFDMYTTATDDAHIVNQPVDEGGAYETTADLVTDVTHYVDGTDAGVVIGTNKYFNLVVWGIQNRSGEASHIMINLPTGQYTTSGNAVADVDGTSIFEIPSVFKDTGFLIARLTFRLIAGSQWTYIAQEDLRGKFPDIIAGVGITTTDHALLANLIAPADDHTQYVLADGTRAMTGDLSLGFGDLVSEQNPDAVNAIRLKGTASDVDVVIGDVTGYFSVWNTVDDNAVFHVNDRGNTDIAGDLIVEGALAGAWDMGSQILTNVNIDTGDINVAVTNTEWDAAFVHVSADGSSHSAVGLNTTHRGSDGSDHSYLDQAVTIASTPNFASLGVGETSPATQFEMTGTSPYLTLHNSTTENAPDGRESIIIFRGVQTGAEETVLAEIRIDHEGSANDQKGKFEISLNDGNDDNTPTPAFRILANGFCAIGQRGAIGVLDPTSTLTITGTAVGELNLLQLHNTGSAAGDEAGIVFAEALSASKTWTASVIARGVTGAFKGDLFLRTNQGIQNTLVNVLRCTSAGDVEIFGECDVTEFYSVDGTQVVSNRIIDARCDDVINSGDATTDGVIDSLRDAMITHGLIAAT